MGGNLLYYGDDLDILRRSVADESVDLVYLDPPFNSSATHNVFFTSQSGDAGTRRSRVGVALRGRSSLDPDSPAEQLEARHQTKGGGA